MPTKTVTKPHATGKAAAPPPSLDITYSMGPITSTSQLIDLGGSYAFGFKLTANTSRDAVYAVSAFALGQHVGWTAQILDPVSIPISAHQEATVAVQVTATTLGETIDPPRCEIVLSAVEISPVTHVIPGQVRLMLMAFKAPPTPDPRVHFVLKDPGGINNRFASGVQPGQLPIGYDVFVDAAGDYTLTAELRDPTGWTIEGIFGSPFHVDTGDTSAKFVTVGPFQHDATAHETDLYLTVAGGPGISTRFTMPIIP